jgi:nicotinate dehydrogenase subunit A
MSAITLHVNGQTHTVDVDPTTPLLYVLSDDLDLRGPKFGCGLGQCGSCTAIVDGEALRTCVTPVSTVDGATVTTLEGLGTPGQLHPLQQAFIDEQAAQCGFCLSGVMLTAKALLDHNPQATNAQIQRTLGDVLCRCFTQSRMLRAIERYARDAREQI